MSNDQKVNCVAVFRTLHRIHRQLTDLRERLARGPRQIRAAEAAVLQRQEALAKLQAEVKAHRMALDRKQLQLKSGEEKVKELKIKLNTAASNREYQALRDQIAADEMANSVLMDEILEAMERSDAYQKELVAAEAALAAARQKLNEIREETAHEEPRLRAEVEQLETELRQEEAFLSGEIQELYRRVVRQRGEDALAVVNDQCCSGCNQQVPINLCSQIMLGRPVACRTCGRLLYLPETG